MKTAREYLLKAAELSMDNSEGYWGPTRPLFWQMGRAIYGDDAFQFELARGMFNAILYGSDKYGDVETVNTDQLVLMYLFAAEMV